jgi:mannan endo-1,4-beta-mannosidase
VLSGQENDPASPGAATATVVQATAKQPAIYATELPGTESASPLSGSAQPASTLAELRQAIVKQAISAHQNRAVVSLSWRPSRPTDDAPAGAHGQLSDFEWNELLTSGSALNTRWSAQVDVAAETLRELQKAGIAVLWNPYPESNGKSFWWAGRKGIHGSAALYRMTFDRLVNHDGLHNLLWVWQAAAPSFSSGDPGPFSDFFPGLLYADALEISLHDANPSFRADAFLAQFAVGKPIGVELTGALPPPAGFADHAAWAWFQIAPPTSSPADSTAHDEALRQLYADPHIVSLAPAQ